jgi:hypothetical protein
MKDANERELLRLRSLMRDPRYWGAKTRPLWRP